MVSMRIFKGSSFSPFRRMSNHGVTPENSSMFAFEEHDPFAARVASHHAPRPLGEVVITLSGEAAKVAVATVAGVRTKADIGPVVNIETVEIEIREKLVPLLLEMFPPTCGVVAHQSGLVGKLNALRGH